MQITGRDKLEEFTGEHTDAKSWIDNWMADTKLAEWKTPQDIKNSYASASFLAGNVAVFNVKGNRYRLEVLVAYKTKTVVILRISTHAEYSKSRKRKK
jgi:mRNA interferase HigB